ncbi:hypothetical protein [Paenibacillus lentus]|uniref:Uncharacterized protein n=1 Tax=Paenibacillus lentus TaxID=1338368 RepID=A0A3Q8S711_9BACL|nr:hypothetical protein [Paenibacillus lentus]AZK48752.1 hypothetical protein EIM92_23325 [Paenibacillus lentus]
MYFQALSFSADTMQQKTTSRLEQIIQIAQSGASDTEKRQMIKNMQLQMDSESMEKLMANLPEVGTTEKLERAERAERAEESQQLEQYDQKDEQLSGGETTNEHGDTVVISQEAMHQYESRLVTFHLQGNHSQFEHSSGNPPSSGESSAATQSSAPSPSVE